MKRTWILACVAVVCLMAVLPAPAADMDAAAFEKLKSLAGTWEADGPEGMTITTTIKVISAGTAVMEEMGVEHMVNVYHPDGKSVMVTHYCAGNNQPRMRATALSGDGRTLAFELVDVTNREGAKEGIMQGLKLTFDDADHFTQEWTSSGPGKEPPTVITYRRKK